MNTEILVVQAVATGAKMSEIRESYGIHAEHEFEDCWNMSWLQGVPEEWELAWRLVEIGGYVEFIDQYGIHWTMEEWS